MLFRVAQGGFALREGKKRIKVLLNYLLGCCLFGQYKISLSLKSFFLNGGQKWRKEELIQQTYYQNKGFFREQLFLSEIVEHGNIFGLVE